MSVDAAFTQAMANDPKMAMAVLAASMTNLNTIMGKVLTSDVIRTVQLLAKGINWLAGAFDRHPNFARGATALMGFGAVAATMKVFGIALR
jgi:hypothetical protein